MSTYERGEERLSETPDVRGTMCARDGCGTSIVWPHTLAGVGAFCSEACRSGRERRPVDPWLVEEGTR